MPEPDAKINRLSAFLTLLVAIFASVMVAPMLVVSVPDLRLERLLGVVVMLAALWAAGVRPVRLLLFAPLVIAHVIVLHSGGMYARVGALAVRAVFFACATTLIGWHVLRKQRVTHDTIAAAACVYMLIGLLWGNLYEMIVVLSPGAFEIPAGWLVEPSRETFLALQYFSFATLTTVGYGDIHPANPTAAGLAVVEAAVGQLYVATTIARLVALQLIQRPDKHEP